MRLDEELIAVTRALGESAIPYALVGGLAVAVWGAPRATKDIDLLVRADDVRAAEVALALRGFTLRAAPMEFSDGMVVHRLSKVEDGGLMTVDLLVVDRNSAPYFESREERFTDAGPLWVIGREALIAMKIAAGRPQESSRRGPPDRARSMNGPPPAGADMSPTAVTARLRHVGAISDLAPERRLDAKLDLSPPASPAASPKRATSCSSASSSPRPGHPLEPFRHRQFFPSPAWGISGERERIVLAQPGKATRSDSYGMLTDRTLSLRPPHPVGKLGPQKFRSVVAA